MGDLPPESDDYIKQSIDHSLGLAVSPAALNLKLLASEASRRRLQDQLFLLQERLFDAQKRIEQSKAEAMMSAQGLRRCVEDRVEIEARHAALVDRCTKLEGECLLYETDREKIMESCDDLARENDELKARLNDASVVVSLLAEIDSLQKDKEHIKINLCRAEEEVKVLFEENTILDQENQMLLKQFNKERHNQGSKHGSDGKHSAASSANGKRKSCPNECVSTEGTIDCNETEAPRSPFVTPGTQFFIF